MSLLTLGASECSRRGAVKPDQSVVFAAAANDKTVIIEGCGSQPVTGYTYCRMREGAETLGKFTLIAPPVKCLSESCVSFELLFPDGQPSLGFVLKKDQIRQDVLWRDLTKTNFFQKNQRGFWPVVMKWKWVSEADGKEYESYEEGEIRLRVLGTNYLPLHEIHEDSNFVWKWTEGKIQYRKTTTGRTSVWKE